MKIETDSVLKGLQRTADERRRAIRSAKDEAVIEGTKYYLSAEGDDKADGKSPGAAWRTLERANAAQLEPGDGLLLRRGDVFRGQVKCRSGVTYAAWGEGEKPAIYGWERDLADPAQWEAAYPERGIWKLKQAMPDCGALVFNGGEEWTRKLIPSWIGGRFVCRDEPEKPFDTEEQMERDLDLFNDCTAVMTDRPSRGEAFPVPVPCFENRGPLYLRCDRGNPGEVFRSIEALPCRHTMAVGDCNDVRIENLCLKYCGSHAIGAGGKSVKGLTVTNCEIGWIGGVIQHYLGTDPNYPEGTRGIVTRYGNGIEIYGGCEDYLCRGNYVYQVYDAGLTHQFTVPDGSKEACVMKNVRYEGNLVEYCVYSIEYFLSNTRDTGSVMDGFAIRDNILRFAGCGWGQQRHNTWTPAHIKSWTFENPARGYEIRGNVFEISRYRLLHLCCGSDADYPAVDGNTYVQRLGGCLGQFGADAEKAPPVLAFHEASDEDIRETVRDAHAAVYSVK